MNPKFQIGDPAMHMHSQTGETKSIAEAHQETAYPRQWWYRLEDGRRWYPESHLWDLFDWQSFQTEQSNYRKAHEAREQAMKTPPPPPQWGDYVTALTNPRYGFQVRQYREAFVEWVDYHYGDWTPPVQLWREYMACVGFREV